MCTTIAIAVILAANALFAWLESRTGPDERRRWVMTDQAGANPLWHAPAMLDLAR